MFVRPSINFPSSQKTFRQLLSTFCASAGPPSNFLYGRGTVHQLSLRPRDLPSSAVNISCVRNIYLKFPCFCQTFRQLSSSFCTSAEPSIYFLYVCRTSIKFCQLFMCPWEHRKVPYGYWIFCQLQSFFHAVAGLSVSFLCIRGTFRQLSVHARDCLLTFCVSAASSVNFSQLLCGRGTFHQHSVCRRKCP